MFASADTGVVFFLGGSSHARVLDDCGRHASVTFHPAQGDQNRPRRGHASRSPYVRRTRLVSTSTIDFASSGNHLRPESAQNRSGEGVEHSQCKDRM